MTDETRTRSMARAHLSQLIDMFGTDGCLRTSTASAHVVGGSASNVVLDCDEPGDNEPT
ncbi:hypothetical protein ACIQRE_12915 [Streptomyces griseoluteus]|uniref:hypothetical protein n=1 Tax=Streptomyces griseoluteus TaxID=29306 RepID=UPI0037F42899